MSEWTIFVVLGAIVAFIISVTTPLLKLNSAIVKLTMAVENLNKQRDEDQRELAEYRKVNDHAHNELFAEQRAIRGRVNLLTDTIFPSKAHRPSELEDAANH